MNDSAGSLPWLKRAKFCRDFATLMNLIADKYDETIEVFGVPHEEEIA